MKTFIIQIILHYISYCVICIILLDVMSYYIASIIQGHSYVLYHCTDLPPWFRAI